MKHPSERRPALFVLNDPNAPRLNPELAKEIGLNESLLFLQLEFWLRQSGKLQEDGQHWIYESVTDIQEVFSFWSRATVNRVIHSLIEKDLLQVGNFNQHRYDRTRWFTLCRKGIEQLKSVRIGDWWVSQNETGSAQDETRSTQNETCKTQDGTTIPDLSPDLSPDQEEPASPDSPPPEWPEQVAALGEEPAPEDDVAETEAMFNKTSGAKLSKEEFQSRHNGTAVVAGKEKRVSYDIPGEPWCNRPVEEWCKLAGKSYKDMSIPTRIKLGGIFYKIGTVTDSTPLQVAEAIAQFPFEYAWWEKKIGFEWPGDGFCNRIGMILTPDAEPEPIDLDHPSGDRRPIRL